MPTIKIFTLRLHAHKLTENTKQKPLFRRDLRHPARKRIRNNRSIQFLWPAWMWLKEAQLKSVIGSCRSFARSQNRLSWTWSVSVGWVDRCSVTLNIFRSVAPVYPKSQWTSNSNNCTLNIANYQCCIYADLIGVLVVITTPARRCFSA